MVFIDLEKAFDRVSRDLICAALRAQKVPEIFGHVRKCADKGVAWLFA